MRVVQINTVCGKGSTGRICVGISRVLTRRNVENKILYCSGGTDYPLSEKCAGDRYIKLQALKSRILGNYGYNSSRATERMIRRLKDFRPDIVHLHNIHGHDCDIGKLLGFLAKEKIKVVWTFHDAWAFTGYCTYFTMVGCERWRDSCGSCPQRGQYSWFFDRSKALLKRKLDSIASLDLTVVTPSAWLAELAGQSRICGADIRVINNGIDLSVFKPTESPLRKEWDCQDKYILLGVAFDWGRRKGVDVFAYLAEKLGDKYQIVMVGTDEQVEKTLPDNIITIRRTHSPEQLAQIYSAADLLVNPTREENFPTVNIESLACGTPVLTFNTGGSPEIPDDSCGKVVECDDISALEQQIEAICTEGRYSAENCVRRAAGFDMTQRFEEYVDLYFELADGKRK